MKPDPNLMLFAEKMIEMVSIADNSMQLREFWKANQATLDDLKNKLPDEFQKVLARFKEAQSSMKAMESQNGS